MKYKVINFQIPISSAIFSHNNKNPKMKTNFRNNLILFLETAMFKSSPIYI